MHTIIDTVAMFFLPRYFAYIDFTFALGNLSYASDTVLVNPGSWNTEALGRNILFIRSNLQSAKSFLRQDYRCSLATAEALAFLKLNSLLMRA